MGIPAFRAASEALLARRRVQKGSRTFGDDHDRALARALALTPPEPALLDEVEATGVLLGRDVYARRFFEDDLAGATTILSTCLAQSGLGSVRLVSHFLRTAHLDYARPPELGPAAVPLVKGVARGFYASTFNCDVDVRADGDALHVRLLRGRDVNVDKGASA